MGIASSIFSDHNKCIALIMISPECAVLVSHTHTHTHTHTHIDFVYIYIYMCVYENNSLLILWWHRLLHGLWSLASRYINTIYIWRCPWCNGYRCRKWTRRHEFNSWTKLIALHIALIPLGKIWIQLFSLQLWVDSRTDWVLQPMWGN